MSDEFKKHVDARTKLFKKMTDSVFRSVMKSGIHVICVPSYKEFSYVKSEILRVKSMFPMRASFYTIISDRDVGAIAANIAYFSVYEDHILVITKNALENEILKKSLLNFEMHIIDKMAYD
jgi:hypothetical protein